MNRGLLFLSSVLAANLMSGCSGLPGKRATAIPIGATPKGYLLTVYWSSWAGKKLSEMRLNVRLETPYSMEVTDDSGNYYRVAGLLRKSGGSDFQIEGFDLRARWARGQGPSCTVPKLDMKLDVTWGVGVIHGESFSVKISKVDRGERDGPANGNQPSRSETNSTSSAAGSRR